MIFTIFSINPHDSAMRMMPSHNASAPINPNVTVRTAVLLMSRAACVIARSFRNRVVGSSSSVRIAPSTPGDALRFGRVACSGLASPSSIVRIAARRGVSGAVAAKVTRYPCSSGVIVAGIVAGGASVVLKCARYSSSATTTSTGVSWPTVAPRPVIVTARGRPLA